MKFDTRPSTYVIGLRKFTIKYIFGEGWKIVDDITGEEIRSQALNGLYDTKVAAKIGLDDYMETRMPKWQKE